MKPENKSAKRNLSTSKLYYDEELEHDGVVEEVSAESEDENKSEVDDEFWESTNKWLGISEPESLKTLSRSSHTTCIFWFVLPFSRSLPASPILSRALSSRHNRCHYHYHSPITLTITITKSLHRSLALSFSCTITITLYHCHSRYYHYHVHYHYQIAFSGENEIIFKAVTLNVTHTVTAFTSLSMSTVSFGQSV
jgi:hypothetical protein